MKITRKCQLTGAVNTMDLDVDDDQMTRYESGDGLIQNIFPNLNADEREFIKTGVTAEVWDAMFGGTDELTTDVEVTEQPIPEYMKEELNDCDDGIPPLESAACFSDESMEMLKELLKDDK